LRSKLLGASRKTEGHTKGLALASANFGGIDAIKPFPQVVGIDTYLYTDAEGFSGADPAAVASWRRVIVPDYPRHDFGPRLRGRYFKHQIHRLPEMEPYQWLAWADASLQFRDPSFLLRETERLAALAPHQRVALVPHPDRNTIREEYEFIRQEIEKGNEYLRLRYANEKMMEQMNSFEGRGWNLDSRLWCGTIWVIENNDLIARCWDSWWDQNLRYGMMDQLSLPVLLHWFGLEPQAMDFNLSHNSFFDWVMHRNIM
jgi:hypothetical protein